MSRSPRVLYNLGCQLIFSGSLIFPDQENFNRVNIILRRTMGIVPMNVHQVGEFLKFNLGISHIVLDM